MTQLESKQLLKVEKLFDAGKIDEALEILKKYNQFEKINSKQKEHILYLKGLMFFYQNKSKELIQLGNQMVLEGQKSSGKIQYFDGIFFLIIGMFLGDKFVEANKLIEKAEDLLKQISQLPIEFLIQRDSRIKILKGLMALNTNDINLAEKNIKQVMRLEKELKDTFELVWAYLLMTQIYIQVKNNYPLAIEYSKKAIYYANRIKFNQYWLGYCYIALGAANTLVCEYDKSLKYYMKSLRIFKQINNGFYIALIYDNIGLNYCDKGEYDLSLNYLQKSLILWERYSLQIGAILDSLIYVTLEKGDNKLAKLYFRQLEKRYEEKKDNYTKIIYIYNKAVILKTQSRIRDKVEAEKLFKEVIETKNIFLNYKIYAYIHLCDLLFQEFQINNSKDIIEEVNQNITKLLNIAEKSHSYKVFCETYILKANLALLDFNMTKARKYLSEAQKIAESNGIKRLAIKISYEHDKLIKQLDLWKGLKDSKLSISDRWRFAGLREQMDNVKKKGVSNVPELLDEIPVFLLIISEGGMPFFSHSFTDDKKFEEHLFGGFFSTINSYIYQTFSEGLDRASFGKYTLLLNSISPFLVFYVYEGQSYSAQYRLRNFINKIKSNQELWQNLEKFYKINREFNIKDIPLFERLITNIFIKKVKPS